MNYRIHALFLLLLLALPGWMAAQKEVTGTVYELSEGTKIPVEAAKVFLKKARVGILTNDEGAFHLPYREGDTLVVQHAAYEDYVLPLTAPGELEILLENGITTETVEIRARQKSTVVSLLDPIQTELLTGRELGKAACCNLSESFETNAAVDVSNNDAATGSKEIRLLGLAGRYAQVMTERRPMIRGLGLPYGLNYIPGSWIESIQISKGAGSVDNGYESITGEINVELMKPERAPRLFLNLYGNQFGRAEGNLITRARLDTNLHTSLMTHVSMEKTRWDQDSDGFLNNPLYHLLTAENRWKWDGPGNICLQVGIRGLMEDRVGGQAQFDPNRDRFSDSVYGLGISTRRMEAFAKFGKANLDDKPYRSWGFIFSGFLHDMDTYFGKVTYQGLERNFRANFNYQDIIVTTRHKWRAGASYLLDDFREEMNDSLFLRTESVPGLWAEYTWSYLEKLTIVTGLRTDYHNLFGLMWSPRVHLRFNPWERTAFRISAGKGYRTPNAIAENMAVLASSRTWVIRGTPQQESAWTYGASLVQEFDLLGRTGSFALDAYRTFFENRYLADLENPREIVLYNVQGGSVSDVAQAEVNAEILPRLDLRIAYKWQYVRADFGGVEKEMPFTPRSNALLNLAWMNATERWWLDLTLARTGKQRIPATEGNPHPYHSLTTSPAFLRLNAQVTRTLREGMDVYLGGENLTNFMQHMPVIAPDDPMGPWFDASMAWGPTMGRMVYAGLRWTVK